jgi:hypothetical protein
MNLIQTVQAAAVTSTLINPLTNVTTLSQVFGMIANLVIGVGWSLVVIMVAMGFIQYIVSQGEKTAVEKAQRWLTYAVIGGVGLFFVSVLKTIMQNVFGGQDIGSLVGGDVVIK